MRDYRAILCKAVHRDYERWALSQDDGEKTLAVAKTICRSLGVDPDETVMGWPRETPMNAGYHQIGVNGRFEPAWTEFWRAAKDAIEEYERL